MLKKIAFLMSITFFCLSLSGCIVPKGKYLKKVEETEDLNKNLTSLQQELEEVLENLRQLEQKRADLQRSGEEKDQEIKELSKRVADFEIEKIKLRKSEEDKIKEASRTYDDMLNKMEAEIAQGQVTITELKGKLTLNMVDSILFDSGQANIKSGGMDVLQKVIDILKEVEGKVIRIEGHTDNVKISGALSRRYPTNWELSASRAINVAKYLQNQGIDPVNLSTAAYGEYKPVASNETQEGRAQNRRIEIVLVPKD